MPTLAMLWMAAALALPPNVEKLDAAGGFTQYRLKSNGMTILVAPNHAAPVFTFYVVYHVGSRNESPGNTGSAHLLEHMLFNKSTENFGKAHGHKTFQEILYEAGADFASTNMTTWNDRMTGYSTLPSDRLELAMRIEADRLGRGLILDEERQPEMSVVRNEYEIGENDPWQALNKAVVGTAIVAHPYHWDTIGYRSDIEGVSTEKLREHYKTFFWPDNAEAILVGDFDTETALRLFDQQFGGFPKSTKPIPSIVTVEPPQEGERRVRVRRPGSVGMVHLGFIRPGALDPDFIPLDVLSNILGAGINSRLYQALVETGLATDPFSWNQAFRDPFLIYFGATVADGMKHEAVEAALKDALFKVAKDGVTDEELSRAKKQIEVSVIRSRDGTYNLASSVAEAVASADWKWFVDYLDIMNRVTAADVKRVAARYLVADHATVGWFMPADPAEMSPAEKVEASPAAPPPVRASSTSTSDAPTEVAAAVAEPFATRTRHQVLENGATVDVVQNRAVPTVAIQGLLLAGDMEAPASNPAIPELTARMLERGTTSRTKLEIGARLDGAGATLSLGTSTTDFTIAGSGLSRDLPLLLEILADELMNPAFLDSEFVKAKLEMKNAILQASENTRGRAFDRLTQLEFPPGHPFRAPTTEEWLAGIEAATIDDLRAFHRERIGGASLFFAIAGDVDQDEAIGLVEKHLGALPRGSRPAVTAERTAPGKPVREVVRMPGKANIDFVYGHASGLRRTDPDYEAALIANAALGQNSLSSRIGKRVRDTEGLSYNLFSRFRPADVVDGVWFVDVAVAPQNLGKALASTFDEIEKYGREGISAAEVESQKTFFAGNYNVRLGTNAGVAAALVDATKFGYGPDYLDNFPARIRAVTKEQADLAVRKFLHPDRMSLIVAGDVEHLP